jgi:phospholipid transport system substrate-binding protein
MIGFGVGKGAYKGVVMKRLLGWLACVAFGLALHATARADTIAPDVMVKNVTSEVLDIVSKDKDIQSGNTRKAIDLVETKVLPYFDFQRMTAQAVGRSWRQASAAQQKVLAEEFRTMLTRTYANALTAYKNQTVDFKPLKMAPTDLEVTVQSSIKQPGAKPISLDYAMEKDASGWKVYDFVVGGISLVTSYRDQFSQQIAADGIDGLIKSLQAKNASLDAAVAKK